LRQEMTGEERELFEEKLSADTEFKADFDFYRAHRQEILAQELAEYDESFIPKKHNISWLYLIISVLGLVLVADYYFSESYDSHAHREQRQKSLIERLSFFK